MNQGVSGYSIRHDNELVVLRTSVFQLDVRNRLLEPRNLSSKMFRILCVSFNACCIKRSKDGTDVN
jgi:hypothetical protein